MPLKQGGELGDQGGTQHDDTAASHELLHALGLGAGVIGTVAFQQVHNAPHAQASAQSDNEGLQSGNSRSEKSRPV